MTKEQIIEEAKKGNVVINTIEGIVMAPIKELASQPVNGLLYDLNRDECTILSFIDDPKWINDYACAMVIRHLKAEIATLQNKLGWISADLARYESDLADALAREKIAQNIIEEKHREIEKLKHREKL